MGWVEKLPEKIRDSLDSLIADTEKHDNAYNQAENPSVGQIWVSMALLNQRMEKIEDRLQAQRKALKEKGINPDKGLDGNLEKSLKNY
ncbi:MAG: hypothetical protein ABEJ93_01330 [Candidatus Nanohalobium sp.]